MLGVTAKPSLLCRLCSYSEGEIYYIFNDKYMHHN